MKTVSITIQNKCNQFARNIKFNPQKCPVYLRLPWLGNDSTHLIEQIKESIIYCFFVVNLRFVLKSNMVFPPNLTDSEPFHHKSILIYQFKSKCDICYIRCITQRFENWIKQHVPSTIQLHNQTLPASSTNQNSDSGVA